jgi:transaldolase
MTNPLLQLGQAGQAVWFDFVQRDMLENGGLKALIEQDGVTGVTSNPAIFEKAIGGSGDYDAALKAFVEAGDADPAAVSSTWRWRTSRRRRISCARSTTA